MAKQMMHTLEAGFQYVSVSGDTITVLHKEGYGNYPVFARFSGEEGEGDVWLEEDGEATNPARSVALPQEAIDLRVKQGVVYKVRGDSKLRARVLAQVNHRQSMVVEYFRDSDDVTIAVTQTYPNGQVMAVSQDDWDLVEDQPLVLRVGGRYLTRGGHLATIVAEGDFFGRDKFLVLFHKKNERGSDNSGTVPESGQFMEGSESPFDILEEVKQEKQEA